MTVPRGQSGAPKGRHPKPAALVHALEERGGRAARAIERLVGADVRSGEGRLVALFFVDLLVLLTAYYILKVIREPLILLEGGAVARSYARGLQALLLIGAIPAYGMLANRIEPSRLVNGVTGFFVACLLLFRVLAEFGVSLGFAFFVWLGIFSTFVIAQFWSLANDLLSESEGKRLFPLVAAGGTLGAIVGSQIAARTIGLWRLHDLLLVAAGLLLACVALTRAAHGAVLEYRRRVPPDDPPEERDPRGRLTLVFGDRYLLLIGLSVIVLNLINTTGDFILAGLVKEHAEAIATTGADAERARQQFVTAFYGDFQTWVSALAAALQVGLVARVFRLAGFDRSLLILPSLAIGVYGVSALVPVLALVAVLKIAENSTEYSLQNTIQQALFLTTSRDAKYKAKAAIDTLFVRVGDFASTAVVFVGTAVGLGLSGFALVNVGAGVVWLAIAVAIARRHREAAAPAAGGGAPRGASRPGARSAIAS